MSKIDYKELQYNKTALGNKLHTSEMQKIQNIKLTPY